MHARTNLFKRRSGRRLGGDQLEDHITLWYLHHVSRRFFALIKNSFHQLGGRFQAGQAVLAAEESRRDDGGALGSGGPFGAGSARPAPPRIRGDLRGAGRLSFLYPSFTSRPSLNEKSSAGPLPVFDPAQ